LGLLPGRRGFRPGATLRASSGSTGGAGGFD
jgi:hypothetical protein